MVPIIGSVIPTNEYLIILARICTKLNPIINLSKENRLFVENG
jgi:hypothetical protein